MVQNATQINVARAKDWATVRKDVDPSSRKRADLVVVEAITAPKNNADEWKQIHWAEGASKPAPGQLNRRSLSPEASRTIPCEIEVADFRRACGLLDHDTGHRVNLQPLGVLHILDPGAGNLHMRAYCWQLYRAVESFAGGFGILLCHRKQANDFEHKVATFMALVSGVEEFLLAGGECPVDRRK